ncbi:NSL1 protein, partial [Rhinopomastus cyanomelas]|nr:NSL1 protein [Rhinopomastus cyanomelas]
PTAMPGLRGRGGKRSGSASGPALSPQQRREMAAGAAPPLLPPPEAGAGPPLSSVASTSSSSSSVREDPRVRCCSQRRLDELLATCRPFLRNLARGQPGEAFEEDAVWSFETAVRENVTVNEEPSGDGSEQYSESSIKILEDEFDELIVEVSAKRKQWPRKILMQAVQTMKAEQEMLKLYQPLVTPEEVRSQPSQDACIADLTQLTETASEQISEALKSLPVLIERAEGFSQALTWQPTLELCRLRQEVFAVCKAKKENNVQKLVSPEVTPTDADTSKNSSVLLKRKRAVGSPERKRYPLQQRKINGST